MSGRNIISLGVIVIFISLSHCHHVPDENGDDLTYRWRARSDQGNPLVDHQVDGLKAHGDEEGERDDRRNPEVGEVHAEGLPPSHSEREREHERISHDPRDHQLANGRARNGDEGGELDYRKNPEEDDVEGPPSDFGHLESHLKGYERYEGVGIYKFHDEGANSFDAANQICEEEGGHLAIAGSIEEADVLVTLWMRHGPAEENDAYVGIHNRNPENGYRTVQGNTLTSTGYVAWRMGEPDNKYGAERCVSFFRYGGYRDITCHGPRPFICELRWKNEN